MLPSKLAFVDIETTGLNPTFDRIIEIGILRVEDNKLVESFQTLINPEGSIPEEISGLTGITREDLENAPSFYKVAKKIIELLSDCYFVAHSARFDYSFLKQEFKRLEHTFTSKQICTVKLSRLLYPNWHGHNLDVLIEKFNLDCENRHRAFDDASVLWQFYQRLQKEFDEQKLEVVLKKLFQKPSIPLKINEEILDSLPETSGVYIFYGSSNSVLYVGKSVNIKKRVLQHFASDYLSSKELKIAQTIENIDYIETQGEMGALIKEAALIKELQPLYNRMLRNSREILALNKILDETGYTKVKLETTSEIEITDLASLLTISKSKRQAQSFLRDLAKQYGLCEKLLGLESTKGACFGYRLGTCKGACIGKENPFLYNARFEMAFVKHAIRPWPYGSPIIIKEISDQDTEAGFLVDKWCFLGKVSTTYQATNWNLEKEAKFDFDTYKILSKFLKTQKGIKIYPVIGQFPSVNS